MHSIDNQRLNLINELEEKTRYEFKNKQLLNIALTHSSYANQYDLPYAEHNERLEFLGDSVLSLVISEHIFNLNRSNTEGKLTKMRAGIVCEASLYQFAKDLNLGKYMLIGKGEEMTGGRERTSILADAYEALIAAIYIDGGYDKVRKFIISNFSDILNLSSVGEVIKDYKSRLQEFVQKDPGAVLRYETEKEEGPAHNRFFYVKLSLNDKFISRGTGKSKKEAEQEAAKFAIEVLGEEK
ncbi:ribonuclease 3 [Oxobacter pfennigii]|uniref:Ribonuclease 3 n=1 Tax=Oxobacter pfennigii TaxID=36849 RepID=A0A0P8W5J7_9CLOT|nr:ribonuclease III [Oxobacter pfennigii]KPU43942.1 ribonuclease 3 [Oxobacter pfennigii]